MPERQLMDPVQIIVTIAICVGALLVLAFLIWIIAASILLRKAKKTLLDFESDFDHSATLRPGVSRVTNRTGRPERVFGRNQRGPLL